MNYCPAHIWLQDLSAKLDHPAIGVEKNNLSWINHPKNGQIHITTGPEKCISADYIWNPVKLLGFFTITVLPTSNHLQRPESKVMNVLYKNYLTLFQNCFMSQGAKTLEKRFKATCFYKHIVKLPSMDPDMATTAAVMSLRVALE